MPTCNCGGKKVQIKKHTPKKASVKKAAAPKGKTGEMSARSRRLSRQARAAALAKPNPFAKGCKC